MSRKIEIVMRLGVLSVALFALVGCGVGKFFIERAITGMEANITDEISQYADFTPAQEQRINALASDIAAWIKRDRLPSVVLRLGLMADDIQGNAKLSAATWSSTIGFLENPMLLSQVAGAVESVALLVHGMSAEQIEDVLQKMKEDHLAAESDFHDFDFEDQNKKFSKGLKTVFSEIGISRSRAQITRAREMLGQRQPHIDAEWQAQKKSHHRFVELIKDRTQTEASFVAQFKELWTESEIAVKQLAPQAWEHNAQITFTVLNYLLEDLSSQDRIIAADNIREYADLFTRLSK